MFIKALEVQNSALIKYSQQLLQTGQILPDTYVLDVDQIIENAVMMSKTAQEHSLKLYFMTKQIGRNPWLVKRILDATGAGVVTVDYKEAQTLLDAGIHVNHIGHLVQPPKHLLKYFLNHQPDIVTIYSIEKAIEINQVASELNRVQSVMLKVSDKGDILYPSQEAGFSLSELPDVIRQLKQLNAIKVTGVTHFPCLQWQADTQKTLPTPNLTTLIQAADLLTDHGISIEQINAPSAASTSTFSLLKSYGVTHTEPGHALTGTVPSNHQGQQPEKVAMLYVTEISHHYGDKSYCYGGGVYRRSNMHTAIVSHDELSQHAEILPFDPNSIDYHITLKGHHPISAPVLMCFRAQIFVTRSDVALVEGLHSNTPKLVGIYDALGQFKCQNYSSKLNSNPEGNRHV